MITPRIISVTPKPSYILTVSFEDGTTGDVSLADDLYGPMFEPLKDPEFFNLVQIDSFGAVHWPNDADLAPDALYKTIKKQKTRIA